MVTQGMVSSRKLSGTSSNKSCTTIVSQNDTISISSCSDKPYEGTALCFQNWRDEKSNFDYFGTKRLPLCISSICTNPANQQKSRDQGSPVANIDNPFLHSQMWYPELLRLSLKNQLPLPIKEMLPINSKGSAHTLVKHRALQLATWKISGLSCTMKEY